MSTHSIKGIREQFKAVGKFYTPPELARTLFELLPNRDTARTAYDPTCGNGSLLSQFGDDVEKFGQDIEAAAVAEAIETIPGFTGAVGDTLVDPAWLDRRFDAVIANPPFSIKWTPWVMADPRAAAPTLPSQSRADYAFILHCLHVLADDGAAAILGFPGILYRGQREGVIRQWLIESNVVDAVHLFPGDKFTDTSIATCALVLRKNRNADEPILFADHEHGITADVAVATVAENGFTLSVSAYAQPSPPEVEPVDVLAIEQAAQDALIKRLTNEIRFTAQVARMEGKPELVDLLLNRIELVVCDERLALLNERGAAA